MEADDGHLRSCSHTAHLLPAAPTGSWDGAEAPDAHHCQDGGHDGTRLNSFPDLLRRSCRMPNGDQNARFTAPGDK